MNKIEQLIFLLLILLTNSFVYSAPEKQLPLHLIKLPLGFKINIYADNVPGARELTLGKNGIVYVGSRGQGNVYALIPNKTLSHAIKTITIAKNLNDPIGVAYRPDDLYVSEIDSILKYPNISTHIYKPLNPIVINNKLPNRRWHGYKFIRFGPDGYLYVGVGMPCNTCNYRKIQPMFGTIMRMKPNGQDLQIYAKGIRNTVGFDWNPMTKVLWFSDNGQDLMGDNLPPDEINRAPNKGLDFGFPFVYGNNILAPGYKAINTKNFTKPAYNLPAHVAPLGVEFYKGTQFPLKFHHQLFIAEHGSWNRSSKVGYQVVVATIKDGKVQQVKPFAYGWLQGQQDWGRPVDLLTMPDGSLLVSDDKAGVIYRISYDKK